MVSMELFVCVSFYVILHMFISVFVCLFMVVFVACSSVWVGTFG